MITPKAGYSMMRPPSSSPDRATPTARRAPSGPHAKLSARDRQGRRHARISRPAPQASDLGARHRRFSGNGPRQPCARRHECRPNAQTMRGSDNALHETRSRGRSLVSLYNTARPHGSLGYKPPAPEVFVPAMAARTAAQPHPSARRPPPALASRPSIH